jgi:uncharacterized membrane protein
MRTSKDTFTKRFFEFIVIIGVYAMFSALQGLWGWTCDRIIYGDEQKYRSITAFSIVIGWLSSLIHTMVIGSFLFCSGLFLIHFPMSKENFEGDKERINFSRASLLFCALIPLLITYPSTYGIEVITIKTEDPANMWTTEGAMYVLAGYMKAIPFLIFTGVCELEHKRTQDKENKTNKTSKDTTSHV